MRSDLPEMRRASVITRFLAIAFIGSLPAMISSSALGQAPGPRRSLATPETAQAHLSKGFEALKNDRYGPAVNEFRAALKQNPALVLRARFPLAVALFELHRQAESRREFEIVKRESGDHPNIFYYLGRLDIEDRNFNSAIDNLSKAVADPPFPDTSYYLGFAYFKNGNMAAAEKWFGEAQHAMPHDARVTYQVGLVYQKQGRDADARKAIEQSNQQRQADAAQSNLRLQCALTLDKEPLKIAQSICDQLYDPDDADKLTSLGTLYGQHGALEAALKPLQRAAELSPRSPQMQYNLALNYYQLKRFEDARNTIAPAATQWPDLFQLVALHGKVLAKLGDDLPAYETLHHAHDLNPSDSEVSDLLFLSILKLGYKRGESRQYSESQQYFEEASRLRPNDPEPHIGLAAVFSQTARPAQAASEQRLAERLTKSEHQSQ
jgi:protein O-GlcNAc transferase